MNYNDIAAIIANASDKLFEKLLDADNDRLWDADANVRRNGLRRLTYNLKSIGLTVNDWDMWIAN